MWLYFCFQNQGASTYQNTIAFISMKNSYQTTDKDATKIVL